MLGAWARQGKAGPEGCRWYSLHPLHPPKLHKIQTPACALALRRRLHLALSQYLLTRNKTVKKGSPGHGYYWSGADRELSEVRGAEVATVGLRARPGHEIQDTAKKPALVRSVELQHFSALGYWTRCHPCLPGSCTLPLVL